MKRVAYSQGQNARKIMLCGCLEGRDCCECACLMAAEGALIVPQYVFIKALARNIILALTSIEGTV